ncbi:MAG TPA: FxsA family protein, partial [Acetobacteraceae bacterium]|nr:FxsA family protein [Acetobacteraceae bacterium]
LVLAEWYWIHRTAEFVLKKLGIGGQHWAHAHRLEGKLLSIEGYTHSGSTFLRSNIRPELRERVISHIHLQWSLRRCVRRGIPTILLVRNPMQACASKHFRSAVRNGYGTTISMFSALAIWIIYHRRAWRYREHLNIIMFPELVRDYDAVRQRTEACSGVRMLERPTFDDRNEFVGERPPLRLSWISRVLAKIALKQYRQFASVAHAQCDTQARPMLPHTSPPLGKPHGAMARWRAMWLRPQNALLCGFVLFEMLVDWCCSQDFGLADLALADIACAIFGFVILVVALRRLDYVERAGNLLSSQEARRADWDAAICIVAAMVVILPGMGGDIAGIMLLLPPIRHFLVTKLERATKRQHVLVFGTGS